MENSPLGRNRPNIIVEIILIVVKRPETRRLRHFQASASSVTAQQHENYAIMLPAPFPYIRVLLFLVVLRRPTLSSSWPNYLLLTAMADAVMPSWSTLVVNFPLSKVSKGLGLNEAILYHDCLYLSRSTRRCKNDDKRQETCQASKKSCSIAKGFL